jgi:hypothetical protein
VGRLFDNILAAVESDRFIVSWHADERCEDREVSPWQLIAGIEDAHLVRERPRSKPHPSVVLRQQLADGNEAEVIWAWLPDTRRAKLVTVYFRD